MEQMGEKRYYWLKLNQNFFQRQEIEIVEALPSGKEYVLFYLKLLCLSISNEGELRLSDTIPYSDSMLSTLTRTDIETVRSAVKAFTEIGLMETLDDGALFMKEVQGMIGSASASDGALRVARHRERKRLQSQNESVTPALQSVTRDKEIKRIENRDKEREGKRFVPPTVEEVSDYCFEKGYCFDPEAFVAYYASQKWKKANGQPLSDWKQACVTWETREKARIAEKPKKRNTRPAEQHDYNFDGIEAMLLQKQKEGYH